MKMGECLNGFIINLFGGIGLFQTIYIIILIFFISLIVKVTKFKFKITLLMHLIVHFHI